MLKKTACVTDAMGRIGRKLARGTGNRGDVHYSSNRLLSKEFTYPLDLRATVRNLMLDMQESD